MFSFCLNLCLCVQHICEATKLYYGFLHSFLTKIKIVKSIKALLLLMLLTLLNTSLVHAQINLVPNGSFEEYSTCPIGAGQNLPNKWVSFSASPDYYNSCADTVTGMSIPHNIAGFQYAANGNAYIGIVTVYFDNGDNESLRETIGSELIDPLVVGKTYFVSFKVNYASGWGVNNCRPSNNIGISFSTTLSPKPINNFAQVYTSYVIQDSLNWTIVSGSFVADSAYKYLLLGNFFDIRHTTVINPSKPFYNSYYLIDDVKLSPDSVFVNDIQNILYSTDFSVYPNPACDFINVAFNDSKRHQLIVYNSIGEIISVSSVIEQREINIAALPKGIYFVKVNNSSIIKKLIIY